VAFHRVCVAHLTLGVEPYYNPPGQRLSGAVLWSNFPEKSGTLQYRSYYIILLLLHIHLPTYQQKSIVFHKTFFDDFYLKLLRNHREPATFLILYFLHLTIDYKLYELQKKLCFYTSYTKPQYI